MSGHVCQACGRGIRAPKSNRVANSWGYIGEESNGRRQITEAREMSLRIHNQSPLFGTHLRIDRRYEGFANGAEQTGRLTNGFIISTQEMGGMAGGRVSLPVSRNRRGWSDRGRGVCATGGGTLRRGRRHRIGGGAGMKRSNKGTPLGHRCRCMLEEGTQAQGWGGGAMEEGEGDSCVRCLLALALKLSFKVSMVACRLFGL